MIAMQLIEKSRLPTHARRAATAAVFVGALLASGAGALAQPAAAGFSVSPPSPFVTKPSNRNQYDIGVGIDSRTGKPAIAGTSPHLCEAGFKFNAGNNHLTRDQINALAATPERQKQARTAIELVFTLVSQEQFSLQGYSGLEFIGTPKMGPEAANARIFISMVETPAGRATMVCSTIAADLESATPLFAPYARP
jgi:hypothetical protein